MVALVTWWEVGMKRQLLALFVVALIAEISASWWTWVRAPTDSLRVGYQGSFITYELERLVPWLIIFIALNSTLYFIERRALFK
jgi:hypothetical protein